MRVTLADPVIAVSAPHASSPETIRGGTSWGVLWLSQCGGRVWRTAMKRLLLSLWVGGAALYTADTFIFVHSVNLTGHPKFVSASAGQPASSNTSQSISTSLPSRSPPATPDHAPSVRLPSQTSQIAKTSVPFLGTEEKGDTPPITESENEERIWVEVSRAAQVHAGPSVSAPTLRFYALGTELHLLGTSKAGLKSQIPRHRNRDGSTKSILRRSVLLVRGGSHRS